MPITRAEARAALNHAVVTVFGTQDDGPLAKALEKGGYQDIRDVLVMTPRDLDDLRYNDSTGAAVPVPRRHLAKIEIFCMFVIHRIEKGDPIGDAWTSITGQEFDDFCISPAFLATQHGLETPAVLSSSTPARACFAKSSLELLELDEKPTDEAKKEPVAEFEDELAAEVRTEPIAEFKRKANQAPVDKTEPQPVSEIKVEPATEIKTGVPSAAPLFTTLVNETRGSDGNDFVPTALNDLRMGSEGDIDDSDSINAPSGTKNHQDSVKQDVLAANPVRRFCGNVMPSSAALRRVPTTSWPLKPLVCRVIGVSSWANACGDVVLSSVASRHVPTTSWPLRPLVRHIIDILSCANDALGSLGLLWDAVFCNVVFIRRSCNDIMPSSVALRHMPTTSWPLRCSCGNVVPSSVALRHVPTTSWPLRPLVCRIIDVSSCANNTLGSLGLLWDAVSSSVVFIRCSCSDVVPSCNDIVPSSAALCHVPTTSWPLRPLVYHVVGVSSWTNDILASQAILCTASFCRAPTSLACQTSCCDIFNIGNKGDISGDHGMKTPSKIDTESDIRNDSLPIALHGLRMGSEGDVDDHSSNTKESRVLVAPLMKPPSEVSRGIKSPSNSSHCLFGADGYLLPLMDWAAVLSWIKKDHVCSDTARPSCSMHRCHSLGSERSVLAVMRQHLLGSRRFS